MLTYCKKCRKKTENLNSKIFKTKYETNYAIKMFCLWNLKVKICERTRSKRVIE